jgi:glycogen operon protein
MVETRATGRMVPTGLRRHIVLAVLCALPMTGGLPGAARADVVYPPGTPALGAHYDAAGANIRFRIYSSRATKIDLYLYDVAFGADEKVIVALEKGPSTDVWSATVPVADLRARGIGGTVYYGYRAWGPNWPFDPAWEKGSQAGFGGNDDDDGNRFNPNKLLLDPYAAEVSHDPRNPRNGNGTIYASGPDNRSRNSGRVAPKGVVLMPDATDVGTRPTRPLREEIIYEVHLRGFTKQDTAIADPDDRGTYKGAAQKADYLKTLGVTAVEFLPVHEFDNDHNDVDPGPQGDDYWGYATLGYFAPDRRYARDKSPGGPSREFKAMVKAFHDRGIKVYLDVVYNHTGEGGPSGGDRGDTAGILSWRGLDNRTYYELTDGNRFYYDNTGVWGNFNCANRVVRDQILDSLLYWSKVMGVDGFRFDLAPVLGNRLDHQLPNNGEGFVFDKMPADNPLNRAARELPVRPADGGAGVDLIAEPWNARGDFSQQQGNFPAGWAEWNDRFRDTFRRSQNKLDVDDVTPGDLATRFGGSRDLYQDDGRKPWHSINSLVEHDGPCLRDLYAFNNDGRRAWNQDGDVGLQRQAARNGFALPLLSIGTPMFTGGDEMYRTQLGNDNPFDIDSPENYLDWSNVAAHRRHFDFARRVIAFRRAHPALRPADYFDGNDHNGNGLKDITWYRDDAHEPDNAYWNARDRHFLAYRIDGTEFHDPAPSIYVGYNGWRLPIKVTLPPPSPGHAWFRAGDTAAWMEDRGNFKEAGQEDRLDGRDYEMKERSVLVLIER